MLNTALPITGFPHLRLARLPDQATDARFQAALRARDFSFTSRAVNPPPGFDGPAVISAITFAFQEATKQR